MGAEKSKSRKVEKSKRRNVETSKKLPIVDCRLSLEITSCLVLLAVMGSACAFAQDSPSVELRLGTAVLEVGEAADAQLVCTNTNEPVIQDWETPEGLVLQLLSQRPSVSQQMLITNNRRSQTVTYTYQLRLIALKEGTYVLGPLKVQAGGKVYETEPVPVTVRKMEAAAGNKGDKYIFAELDVQPRGLYVTQSYRATLTIGVRKLEIGGRIYSIGSLEPIMDARGSQTSVFGLDCPRGSETTIPDSNGVRHTYEIFRCTKEARAEDVGDLLIGPIFLKANYPTSLRRGWFGDLEITSTRRETERLDGVTVQVKGPPEEGRPAGYRGAIGRYTMALTAKPTQVELGQPMTLTVAFRGAPLEGLIGPRLEDNAELASRFDFTKDEPVGDWDQGARVFRRAIFPRSQGPQLIPSIRWSYFDPQTERYVTLISEPVAITVDPPTGAAAGTAGTDLNDSTGQGGGLTVLAGGISPNYVDPTLVLADQSLNLGGMQGVVLGAPPLLYLAIMLTSRHRARLRTDVQWARRRRARQRARRQAARALCEPEPLRQVHGLAETITGYLSDFFNLPPGPLTPLEVRHLLESRAVEPSLTQEIERFLYACDEARYAPANIEPAMPRQAAADIRRWIDRLERTAR
jgi:hypothetical protein